MVEDVRIETIDGHAAGEPLRLITGGFPEPRGASMLAKRAYLREHCDHLRRTLMWEPRGHADMYGALLTAPVTTDGDAGVLFMHNEGYSTMCGHGIIAVVTFGIQEQLLRPGADGAVRLDTPAGRVTARPHMRGTTVEQVSFENVASFVLAADVAINVPGVGSMAVDVAFGGAFYAYVELDRLPAAARLPLDESATPAWIDLGMRIKAAVSEAVQIAHPTGGRGLGFLYGTIVVGPSSSESAPAHSRNVCIFADGEVDRSPTGTGLSGRVAIYHARGELAVGAEIEVESIIGTRFAARVLRATTVGDRPAVVSEIRGAAYITGHHRFVVDPDDPLRHGFLLSRRLDAARARGVRKSGDRSGADLD